jgi:hypothetical protein
MTRKEEIYNAARKSDAPFYFQEGANWADEHPHWISVDEELPEYEEPVLIVKERDGIWNVGTGTLYPYGEKGAWYSQGLEVNVKHWMPRPKLPKK